MLDAHQRTESPKTSRRWLGMLAAVVLAWLAIGGFLIVDWGAMLSGDSTRVQHAAETGSGVWAILAPFLAYAAYRVAKRSWRGQGARLTTRHILTALVSVIVLLFVAGAIKRLVHDAPARQRAVLIAGREVSIPADTPRNVFAVTKAAMKELGFKSWYRNCVIGQAERLLTPTEAKALTGTLNPQKETLALNLAFKVQPNCEEPGREVVDASATPFQLSILKAMGAKTTRLEFAREGLGPRLQTCGADRIRHATDAQILELENGSISAQEAVVLKLVKPCI